MPILEYNRQIAPDTAIVPNQPKVGNPGLVLGAMDKTFDASQQTSKVVGDIGEMIQKHGLKMQDEQDAQQAADLQSSYLQDTQNELSNPDTETVKVDGQDVERPIGLLNRTLGQAKGATDEYASWYAQKREDYLSQVKDPNYKRELQKAMDSHHYATIDNVSNYETKQRRDDIVNSFQSNVNLQIKDAASAQNPDALKSAIVNVTNGQNKINQALNLDADTALLKNQKAIAATVDTAITNTLQTTGSLEAAKGLLDSVKGSVDLDSYDKLQKKLNEGFNAITKTNMRITNIKQTDSEQNILGGLLDGSLNWTNLNKIDDSDVSDKFKMAAKDAIAKKIKNINNPKSANSQVTVSDAGFIKSDDKIFASHIANVLNSGNKEKIMETMGNALNNFGDGKISQDKLNILLRLSIARGSKVPIKMDADNGVQPDSKQAEIDAGTKSILDWQGKTRSSDPQVFNDYFNKLDSGMPVKQAHDEAVRANGLKINKALMGLPVEGKIMVDGNGNKAKVFPDGHYEPVEAKAPTTPKKKATK